MFSILYWLDCHAGEAMEFVYIMFFFVKRLYINNVNPFVGKPFSQSHKSILEFVLGFKFLIELSLLFFFLIHYELIDVEKGPMNWRAMWLLASLNHYINNWVFLNSIFSVSTFSTTQSTMVAWLVFF